MDVFALLTGAFCCENALVSAGWQKGFLLNIKPPSPFVLAIFFCWSWLEGNKWSSNISQLYAFLQLTLLSSLISSMLSKLKTWSGKAAKALGPLPWACPRLSSMGKKSASRKGKWNSGHSSLGAGTSTGQRPHSDVKTEGCLVMETPHKGNLIPTLPAPTTFQSHGHVIGKSTVCLPPPGSPPFPGGGAWRDGHTALAALLTSVAAAGLSTGALP